ncbi:MAG: MFS transporter [Deltaproteobacteria bacterium]|nr:MFS transporter [Deltaproteobacteria bacterium]
MSNKVSSVITDNERIRNGMSLNHHLLPVLFLTFIFFLNFIARVILSPLAPVIEESLGLKHSQVGFFFFLITLGYFISLFGSGFIASRINHGRTIVLSTLSFGVVMFFISATGEVFWTGTGMFLLGLATGMYIPSGIATITDLVTPRQWGKALAIHEFAPSLAYMAAPLVVEILLRHVSWRGVMITVGVVALLAGTAFIRFGRGGETFGVRPDIGSVTSLLFDRSFLMLIALFGLGISSTIGIYSMLPTYLVSHFGMDRVGANTLVALSRISALILVLIAGWATDRFGAVRTIKSTLLLAGMLTVLLGITPRGWITLIVFLQPAFAVCFFPGAFALLSMIVPPEHRSLAVSLAIPAAFMFGAGILPMIIGILGDMGHFTHAFIAAGLCIASGAFLAPLIRNVNREG